MMEKFLDCMRSRGWSIEPDKEQASCLPEPVKNRYPACPESWMRFISAVKSMVSKDEKVWFLCADDFEVQGDKAWQWNEWELISLKAAEDDAAWADEIKKFWDGHLPIILSLENGYAYYAISMKDGSVVYGMEPEFEECETIAKSFGDFMKMAEEGRILG